MTGMLTVGAVIENKICYITNIQLRVTEKKGWQCSLNRHAGKKQLVVENYPVVDV